MRAVLLILMIVISPVLAAAQNWEWALPEKVKMFSVDSAGNIFTYRDNLFKCFNTSGVQQWSLSCSGDLVLEAMATDNAGNVFITGTFTSFSMSPVTLTGSGPQTILLAKINSSGIVWKKVYNSTSYQLRLDLEIAAGKLILNGNADLGTIIEGQSFAEKSMFISRYDLSGNFLSMLKYAGAYVMEIESDALGNIYLLSGIEDDGAVDLGSGISFTGCGPCMGSHFLAKLDHTGQAIWGNNMGTNYYDPHQNLVVDRAEHIYLSDWRRYNGFVIERYDAAGTMEWRNEVEGIYGDCHAMTVDKTDSLWATGYIDNGPVRNQPYAWQYGSAGSMSSSVPASVHATGYCIGADEQQNIYVSGTFVDTASFGSTMLVASSGFFLAKMNRSAAPMITSIKENAKEAISMKVFPNPVNDVLMIEWEGSEDPVQLNIYNASGAIIQTRSLPASQRNIPIDLSNYTPGVYSVEIISGRKKRSEKIILQ